MCCKESQKQKVYDSYVYVGRNKESLKLLIFILLFAKIKSVQTVPDSSRLYPYPPKGRLMEILRGGGIQKHNFLKKSMTLDWNFQRDGGFKLKKTSVGRGLNIFWNNTVTDSFLFF